MANDRESQRKFIWNHLVNYGHVNNHDLIYTHMISRGPARVKEIRKRLEDTDSHLEIITVKCINTGKAIYKLEQKEDERK